MLQYSSDGPDEPALPQKPAKPNKPRPTTPRTTTTRTSTTPTTTTTTEAYYPDEDNYGSDNVEYLDYEEYAENTDDYSQDYSVRNSDYYSEDYGETSDYASADYGSNDYESQDYESKDYADQSTGTENQSGPSVDPSEGGNEAQGCPGGDLETCIDVCPGFNKVAFGFCVAECGQRCP